MLSFYKYISQFQKLCGPGIRRAVSVMILIALIVLGLQNSSQSRGNSVLDELEKTNPSSPVSLESEKTREIVLSVDRKNSTSPIHQVENRVASIVAVTPRNPAPAEKAKAKRKKRMPAKTIQEMNQMLLSSGLSSLSVLTQGPSASDLQILEVKAQIMNAPVVENDLDLYSPVFRNISMFKRSYELMEKTLKVYIYKEGKKPIFHSPQLTGIYSSEGWFMKHLAASRRFLVDDPSMAHLFYMPFSSSILRFEFYIPGDHNHDRVIAYLKNYVATIAAKHPFWNRTGGADHFFVACHDWVPDVTAQTMANAIGAICNADLAADFVMGKDVSLPETNVRSIENPVRGIGGRTAKRRPILAFFAGRMHGYVRPLLLQHWENKDPDMKVFGPLPKGGGGKKMTSYAEYMRSSRYCICPRGNDVNSPRVAEAIFYECVPVIISNNFVPPLFEVLNWEAFSVVVAEEDIPRLKEILLSIPEKKYLALQTGVKKVQRHFLWHLKPERYDLFHMILHSLWLNRVLRRR
ncbi:unnamed protein product [Spirodela intermedia]|uniref:Exostosin GT47 domain-containing protein n=1 Tax=Spirodela intermedia TaxID=51605 RepID=A0A7I8JPD2_SPIIN|nr:unnamed protein product [Spirodela intermedia]CAA6671621.1 unnamed protein product [Spirodela intermedia]